MSHCSFFFFNDTATTEIYTLSLHDALPISPKARPLGEHVCVCGGIMPTMVSVGLYVDPIDRAAVGGRERDRKSTRLNSSHQIISYAVFCLKKKTTYVADPALRALQDSTRRP